MLLRSQFVAEKIEPVENYEKGGGENISRNRYKDILPYDSNMVTLSRPTGKLIRKLSYSLVTINYHFRATKIQVY